MLTLGNNSELRYSFGVNGVIYMGPKEEDTQELRDKFIKLKGELKGVR